LLLVIFFTALKQKQISTYLKALALFIVATIIGLLPNYGNLSTTNEYGKYSTRGKSELTIDYNSIKSARSAAIGLDDRGQSLSLDGKTPSEKIATPGMVDPDAKERHANNKTTGLDKDYATNWSYGIGETFTFLIPDFKGGASGYIGSDQKSLKKVNPQYREQAANGNTYFGDQPFTSGPVYIGAILIFLSVLGMFIVKNSIKWPIFFATLLTVALGWGNNFMGLTDFFMDHVPGYNKFRAVSMIMVIAELTLPLLALLAVNELVKHKNWSEKIKLRLINKEVSLKNILILSVSVVGGFCLLCYLIPDSFNTFVARGEEQQMIASAIRGGNPESEARAYIAELMPQIEIARKSNFYFRCHAIINIYFTGIWCIIFISHQQTQKRIIFCRAWFVYCY